MGQCIKTAAIIITVIVFSLCLAGSAIATDDIDSQIQDELTQYDFSEWDKADSGNIIGSSSALDLIEKYIDGKSASQPKNLFDRVLDLLSACLKSNMGALLAIMGVALATGLCNSLLPDGGSVRDMASMALTTASLAVIVAMFARTVALAGGIIDTVSSYSEIISPISATLLVASGKAATAGVFSPLMSFLSATVIALMRNIMLPLTLLGGVLAVISNISSHIQIKQLLTLTKNLIKWGIGLIATLYTSVVAIYGLSAGNHDGVTIKTLKFLIDKTVPVAGQFVSGTIDTVTLCSGVIKSAAGIASIVLLMVCVLQPLINVLCANAAFRISAALCEPISDERIPKMLASVADMTTLLFVVALVCCAMFVITVGVMMVCV